MALDDVALDDLAQGDRKADPVAGPLRPAAPSRHPEATIDDKSGTNLAPIPDTLTPADPAAPARPVGGWRRLSRPVGGWRTLPGRLGQGLRTAGSSVAAWRHRPYSRAALPAILIFSLVGTSALAGVYVVPALPVTVHRTFSLIDPAAGPAPDSDLPGLDPGAATGTPGSPPPGTDGKATPAALAAWARPLATRLGIPLPAMQAYGYAEMVTATTSPGCQLRWTTLAGIGKIESAHGEHRAPLGPDGAALPPIIGLPLDGQGDRMKIADTDGGQLDLDRTWDHAVGPMQFIPSTWTKYGMDADGNGVADINNINDAALAAARYLCADNRNLSVAGDWWEAIMSYNAVQAYVRDVFNAANDYGVRSR